MSIFEQQIKSFVQHYVITLFPTNHDNRMKTAAAYIERGSKVLDIGCNSYPNKYLDGEITAMDVQLTNFENFPNYKKFIKHNVENKFPIKDHEYDYVVALEVIEHLVSPLIFFDEMVRVLKPGGRLILLTPNPYYWITILSNWFFPRGFSESGVSGGSYEKGNVTTGEYKGHISLLSPRVINLIAKERNLVLINIKEFTGKNLKYGSYGIIYEYKKNS